MKTRKFTIALVALLLGVFALAPMGAAAAPKTPGSLTEQITAPATSTLGAGVLTGTLKITEFKVIDGVLNAVGTLTNAVFTPTGGAGIPLVGSIPIQIPVLGNLATGTCEILELDLGPLHLDLLGLVVDLSAVHLDIVAEAGAGNLLGNLLCAVAHLLDNGGPLNAIANLLNQILSRLG